MEESNRNIIISLIEHKNLEEEKVDEALKKLEILPSSKSWYSFIEQLLLWFGGLALAFSVMFFVAYNWLEFGRFAKFALVEGLMAVSVGFYWYLGGEKLSAKVALMVASILLGVLLALVGQTYQTGADPWQLFFYWAVLMLPWAVIGRFSAIWMVWILLLNVAILLYMETFGRFFGFVLYEESAVVWIFFLFNTMAWIIWDALTVKFKWLENFWAIRILGFVSMTAITGLVLNFIWNNSSILALAVWILCLGAVYLVYRVRNVDLFMLAMAALSFSIVLVNYLINIISWRHFELGYILFIGLVIIGLGAGFASWLKSIQKESEDARA